MYLLPMDVLVQTNCMFIDRCNTHESIYIRNVRCEHCKWEQKISRDVMMGMALLFS